MENLLDITEGGKLATYRAELLKGDESAVEKRFKNAVVRLWNGILQSAGSKDREEMDIKIKMLTGQLQELDYIFDTHFSKGSQFL
jgi:hypothetical protein